MKFLANSVLFILIARSLGVEPFGKLSFAISYTALFLVVLDYGFNLYVVREVAAKPSKANDIANDILNAKMVLTITCSIVMILLTTALKFETEIACVVYLLWVSCVLLSFGSMFNSIFRGLNKFQYETYPTIILNLVLFTVTSLLLLQKYNIVLIAIAFVVSRLIYVLISLYFHNRYVGKLAVNISLCKAFKLIKNTFPFGIHAILGVLYLQLDTVFLSIYSGHSQVGYYQAAMKIVMASMIIYDILITSYFPILAGKFPVDRAGFRSDGKVLTRSMILIGSVLAVMLYIYSPQIINGIYGYKYADSIYLLKLLAIVVLLRFVTASYASFITLADNQKLRAIAVGISVIVNIALNVWLIPQFGAKGAAIASIITHIFVGSIYIVAAVRLTSYSFIDVATCKDIIIIILIGLLTAASFQYYGILCSLVLFVLLLILYFKKDISKVINSVVLFKLANKEI